MLIIMVAILIEGDVIDVAAVDTDTDAYDKINYAYISDGVTNATCTTVIDELLDISCKSCVKILKLLNFYYATNLAFQTQNVES